MDLRSISRRNFLTSASALGAASLFGMPQSASADPPPEITRVTIADTPALCFAPQFVAEELLKFEGFSEVEYVKVVDDIPTTLAKSADISMFGGPSIIPAIDKGYPISVIGALHEGCWELFAHEPIRSLQDLVGRRIAIRSLGGVAFVHTRAGSLFNQAWAGHRRPGVWPPGGHTCVGVCRKCGPG